MSWIFTRFGFFSAVCARKGDGKLAQPVDPNQIMVRARVKAHLQALQKRFKELRPFPIYESANSDYRFRLFCPKGTWAHVMCDLALDLDYDNFKSEVKRFQGKKGAAYESALHRVWGVMYGVQTDEHGPGIYSRPSRVLSDYGINEMDPDMEGEPVPFDGGFPDDEENVLVVLEQDTGQEVGVIWWPYLYDDESHAYAKGVEVGALRQVVHPEYKTCKWGAVKRSYPTVFDVFEFGELEEGDEGEAQLRTPFEDIPVIKLVE